MTKATILFRIRKWLLGKFGRKMRCGCRGYCRGHFGGFSWRYSHGYADYRPQKPEALVEEDE
jgi:hypothetical protein